MIENYRTGLLWKLFMNAPEVKPGLVKLGFHSNTILKMTKYLCLSIALLATLFSFAQTDITGKNGEQQTTN
jgi:hypothetical protein